MPRKKSGTENELWERMPGESVRHYEYFCAYRDMRYIPAANADDIPKLDLSRERSVRKLAQQLGVAKRTIGDLCSRFNWVARCDAYDLYILRRQRVHEAPLVGVEGIDVRAAVEVQHVHVPAA